MLDGVNNQLGTNTQYLALLIDSPCVSSPMLQPDDIVLDSNHTWDLSKNSATTVFEAKNYDKNATFANLRQVRKWFEMRSNQ